MQRDTPSLLADIPFTPIAAALDADGFNWKGTQAMQSIHPPQPVVTRNRLVRMPEVEAMTGYKKSTIYTMLAKERFPKPVRLSSHAVAWPEAVVLQWVQDRIAEANGASEGAAQ